MQSGQSIQSAQLPGTVSTDRPVSTIAQLLRQYSHSVQSLSTVTQLVQSSAVSGAVSTDGPVITVTQSLSQHSRSLSTVSTVGTAGAISQRISCKKSHVTRLRRRVVLDSQINE